MHIAMWSGPRNLSTAMMYSFGARRDFDVLDEPFYGAYLKMTGLDHPMGAQIMETMECDPHRVSASLSGTHDKALYTKQMTHHMIDGVPRDWFEDTQHVFLIRHPARVIASYAVKREQPTLPDLGFVQQAEIFDHVCASGQTPVVVDSVDIRRRPEAVLRQLCVALDLEWDPAMLSWPSGGHASDGIWAAHWYGAVHRSTGFAGAEGVLPELDTQSAELAGKALPYYDRLSAYSGRLVG